MRITIKERNIMVKQEESDGKANWSRKFTHTIPGVPEVTCHKESQGIKLQSYATKLYSEGVLTSPHAHIINTIMCFLFC